jgi:hypothetical protein
MSPQKVKENGATLLKMSSRQISLLMSEGHTDFSKRILMLVK